MPVHSRASHSPLPARAGGYTQWWKQSRTALALLVRAPATHTRVAPHIRDALCVRDLLNNFMIATVPCWLLGLWHLGYQLNTALLTMGPTGAPGWRGTLLRGIGIGTDPGNVFACWMHGFLYFLPVFLVALLVSACWGVLFARVRQRPVDDGVLVFAWLFALLLPAGAPWFQVALGMSFGVVFGKHIFGGTGHYLVNPAVLGAAFLWLAYPQLVFGAASLVPLPGSSQVTVQELAAAGGKDAILAAGRSWWSLFVGAGPGPMGMTSSLGAVLGAAYLLLTNTVSPRVLGGVLLGASATVLVFNTLATDNHLFALAPQWQLLLGGVMFGTVFLATDPVAGATTHAGRWAFGVLVGILALTIQLLNTAIAQPFVFAVFLASLCAPLLDFVVVERFLRRRRRQARGLQHE